MFGINVYAMHGMYIYYYIDIRQPILKKKSGYLQYYNNKEPELDTSLYFKRRLYSPIELVK